MTDRASRDLYRPAILVAVSSSALSGLLLLVLLGVPAVNDWDVTLSQAIQGARFPILDDLMLVASSFGDTVMLTMIAAIILITLVSSGCWKRAGVCLVAFAGTAMFVSLVKWMAHRPRPLADLYSGIDAYSFPSGHMANSAVILGTFALLLSQAWTPRYRVAILGGFSVLVSLIGVSRVYLLAHWPSDVIAGALIAMPVLAIVSVSIGKSAAPIHQKITFAVASGLICVLSIGHASLDFGNAVQRYQINPASVGTMTTTQLPESVKP